MPFMLKKTLIFALVLTTAISPIIPTVHATDADFQPLITQSSWDYGNYRVEKLALDSKDIIQSFAGVTYFSRSAASCVDVATCDAVDLTILQDGKSKILRNANKDFDSSAWKVAQNNRFVYVVKSPLSDQWLKAFLYDPQIKQTNELVTISRKTNQLNATSIASINDRMFVAVLEKDQTNGKMKSRLLAQDLTNNFTRRDFGWEYQTPWQEIADAYEHTALVKFKFAGGYTQLWLIDEQTQIMQAIPDTWTEPQSNIVNAHFLSDGTVEYFRNFRLFTYDPKKDTAPQAHGDAKLSWNVSADDAIQTVGDRTAWIDSANSLYVSDLGQIIKFGLTKNGRFHLGEQAIFFENGDGYRGYDFINKTWTTRKFHVTSQFKDFVVGLDEKNHIWVENRKTDLLIDVGFGSSPVISDANHIYWKGTDNMTYQAILYPVIDLMKPNAQAVKSYTKSTIYLLKDEKIWEINNSDVYFSWFDSWNKVTPMTQAAIELIRETHLNAGNAPYAPGVKIKSVDSPKVYLIGTDGKLHWIVSETVAKSIYGSIWNQSIVEVPATSLWNYSLGSDVGSAAIIKSI